FRGMADAASDLLFEIRRQHPDAVIVLNRAYKLLPRVDRMIDIAFGESVYATYDFDRKEYRLVSTATYLEQVKLLQAAQKRSPGLKVFSLDYCEPADRASLKTIYAVERANGFNPYVATISLTSVVAEPRD